MQFADKEPRLRCYEVSVVASQNPVKRLFFRAEVAVSTSVLQIESSSNKAAVAELR